MSWGQELVKIRRLLRDPDGLIWSESQLRNFYNQVQKDFQNRTSVLEDTAFQRVPDVFQMSYQFEWEWRFLPESQSKFYQCLANHDGVKICHRWEAERHV